VYFVLFSTCSSWRVNRLEDKFVTTASLTIPLLQQHSMSTMDCSSARMNNDLQSITQQTCISVHSKVISARLLCDIITLLMSTRKVTHSTSLLAHLGRLRFMPCFSIIIVTRQHTRSLKTSCRAIRCILPTELSTSCTTIEFCRRQP